MDGEIKGESNCFAAGYHRKKKKSIRAAAPKNSRVRQPAAAAEGRRSSRAQLNQQNDAATGKTIRRTKFKVLCDCKR